MTGTSQDARHAASNDGAALRQDRTSAAPSARGRAGRCLFGLEVGLRGINQELRTRGRVLQHQRQLRGPAWSTAPRFRDKSAADMAKKLGITVEQAAERHAADYALKARHHDADVANAACSGERTPRARSPHRPSVDGGWPCSRG